jgi:putative hydrolase of HD superfamily
VVGEGLLKGILNLLSVAGRLKQIPRTGWVIKAGIGKAESVADHSYRVSLAAMILSDLLGLDTVKAVRIALIHDLAESYIGDLTPQQVEEGLDKSSMEEEVMIKVLQDLPSHVKHLYLEAWRDWVERASSEARLVHEVDAFEMALQAEEYAQSGFDRDKLMEFKRSASERVSSGAVKELIEALG